MRFSYFKLKKYTFGLPTPERVVVKETVAGGRRFYCVVPDAAEALLNVRFWRLNENAFNDTTD